METRDEFENFFRDRLANYEEAPPVEAWQRIQKDIKPVYRKPNRHFTGLLLLIISGITLVISVPNKDSVIGSLRTKLINQHYDESYQETASSKPEIINEENVGRKLIISSPGNTFPAYSDNRRNQALDSSLPTDGALLSNSKHPLVSIHLPDPSVRQLDSLKEERITIRSFDQKVGDKISQSIPAYVDRGSVGIHPSFQSSDVSKTVTHTTPNGDDSAFKIPESPIPNDNKGNLRQEEKPLIELAGVKHADAETNIEIQNDPFNNSELYVDQLQLLTPELHSKRDELPEQLPLLTLEPEFTDTNLPEKNKYSFGLFFSPRYMMLRFTPNVEDRIYILKSNDNAFNSWNLGYEAGFMVTRHFKRIALEGGLMFTKQNEYIEYKDTRGAVESYQYITSENQTQLFDPIFSFDTKAYSSRNYFTGLKGGVGFFPFQRRLNRIRVSTGLTGNILLKSNTYMYNNGTLIQTATNQSAANPLRTANVNLYLGVGYVQTLRNNLDLELSPVLNYYLGLSNQTREAFGIQPYTLGLNVLLRFK